MYHILPNVPDIREDSCLVYDQEVSQQCTADLQGLLELSGLVWMALSWEIAPGRWEHADVADSRESWGGLR